MAAGVQKRETSERIDFRVRLYQRSLWLEIDRRRCIHCDICQLLCPRRALRVEADENGLEIYLDEHRCVLCEVCSTFCPADAIELGFADHAKDLLGRSEALPRLTPRVEVRPENCPHRCEGVAEAADHWCRQQRKTIANRDQDCPKYCFHCIETCPRLAFQEVDRHSAVNPGDCLRCMTCLERCEYGSIHVNPLFAARLLLDAERCPSDCDKCFQVCPVHLFERRAGRVTLIRDHCAYCGACVNVCDQDALRLERDAVLLPEVPAPDRTRLWDRLQRSLISGRPTPARSDADRPPAKAAH